MTEYKAPFGTAHLPDYGLAVCDDDGKVLDVSDVAALLNAHARQSAQRCETCAFKEEKLSAALNGQILCGRTRTVETLPHGCTAHQPKEQA